METKLIFKYNLRPLFSSPAQDGLVCSFGFCVGFNKTARQICRFAVDCGNYAA